MEGLPSFDQLVAARGLSSNDLNFSMKSEHTNEIAKLIGNSWEILATEIGLPQEDIHDIKEVSLHPLDRRRALMRVWEDRYGSAATYRKMAIGLEEIRNRRLTEKVLDLCKSRKQHETRNIVKPFGMFTADVLWAIMCNRVIVVLLISILSSLFVYHSFIVAPLVVTTSDSLPNCSNELQNTQKFNKRAHFNETFHDLPLLRSVFVDRIEDIKNITDKLKKAHIVNICGAPAFGKSTVAIHTGHKLLYDHISVRYVNLEEASLYWWPMSSQHKHNDSSQPPTTSSVSKIEHNLYETNEHNSVSLTTHTDYYTSIELDLDRLKELTEWSEKLNNTTVLIFDNCDSVLIHKNSLRNKFFDLIYLLIEKSHHLLHIIVVSQEKVQLLDMFDQFEVKELDEISSVELLQKLTPNITIPRNQSIFVAKLLQGCPLALKVIGKMLDLYGSQAINGIEEELIKRPLDILNRISDQRQQFRSIMDLVFEKHKMLNDCGYIVSLFPGSFSREAGIAVFTAHCLDAYVRLSLLDEYLLAGQLRYKMHRLIKEYLREKVIKSQTLRFKQIFGAYYTKFLSSYVKKRVINEFDIHLLLSEEHNIDFFQRNTLLAKLREGLSQDEDAILAFLIVNGYAKRDLLSSYFGFVIYLRGPGDKWRRLNPVICRGIIKLIIKHCYCSLYHVAYDTQTDKFYFGPCKSLEHCEMIQEIHLKVQELNISHTEEVMMKHVMNNWCGVEFSIYLELTLRILIWGSLIIASIVAARNNNNSIVLCLLFFVCIYLSVSCFALSALFISKHYFYENYAVVSSLEFYIFKVFETEWICHNILTYIIEYFLEEFLLYIFALILLAFNYNLEIVSFLCLFICTVPMFFIAYFSSLVNLLMFESIKNITYQKLCS